MKILFLANRFPHSAVAGGHRLVFQRMRHLAERGHAVGLAAFSQPGDERHLDAMRRLLIEVEAVPVRTRRLYVRMFHDYVSSSLPAIFWKNHSKAMMRLVGDMVGRTRYDVVVAEFGEMGMYLYRNPYLPAVHKVVSCHRCLATAFAKYAATAGVPAALRLKSVSQVRLVEKFEFEMYGTMDHILTLTEEDRFTLLSYAPQLPVSVIPPGIEFGRDDDARAAKPGAPIVMMCGYFADKSNHDGALWFAGRVWPLLAQRHPGLLCYLVGAGADRELLRLAEAHPRIAVTGPVDDLQPYRDQASIFINPMRLGSGLRIKVLEAMASGLPVVTTSLGGAGIPAQNGVNCFIADTPELFADSVGWLLADRRLAERMGRAAKAMVRSRYDIQTTTRELEKVLDEVVSL